MKNKKLNILFICKYNRFRSRVAHAYFEKLNKNKNIHVKSGGIIVGHYPLDKNEVAIAKKLGIDIKGRPEPVTTDKLIWQDMIIIAADNVPPYLFHFNKKRFGKSVRAWPIPDIKHGEDGKNIERIIKLIMKHVENLVKELE
jgi:protein-tyrosine-phosphatase